MQPRQPMLQPAQPPFFAAGGMGVEAGVAGAGGCCTAIAAED